jgi:hypothetical protein
VRDAVNSTRGTAEGSIDTVAYVIAEPCIEVKNKACVDACPVDYIHPKKDTQYAAGRPGFEQVDQRFIDPVEYIDCGLRASVLSFGVLCSGRPTREVAEL